MLLLLLLLHCASVRSNYVLDLPLIEFQLLHLGKSDAGSMVHLQSMKCKNDGPWPCWTTFAAALSLMLGIQIYLDKAVSLNYIWGPPCLASCCRLMAAVPVFFPLLNAT
jgi:hypothetical protein